LSIGYTFGWASHWNCGVHSDFSKFEKCMNKIKAQFKFLKNIHCVTILRDPKIRYISEWQHMNRKFQLGNRNPLFETKNTCNKEVSISDCLSLNQNVKEFPIEMFISCKNNIAENRQTRLLANYNESDKSCNLFKKENKRQLLESAKNVLMKMSYFALTEYEELSQKLFEKTFKNSFEFNFKVNPSRIQSSAFNASKILNDALNDKIYELNDLDLELYEFAKIQFFKRLKFYRIESE